MMNVIANYVPDFNGEKITINGFEGYKQGDNIYFIMPKPNNEVIHVEQKIISDYFATNGFSNIARPIANQDGQLVTQVEEEDYIVCVGRVGNIAIRESHAKALAEFHQTGANYPYTPNYISSYGQWKTLWQNKVDTFESIYHQQIQERPVTRFQRLFIDTFPYVIGLSENAIQYLQETETDQRFNESDQGSITFQRYMNQMKSEIIWSHELTYDHPIRDVCEYIRPFFLEDDYQSKSQIKTFLAEYEQFRSFSVFGWRLLYARLLFPVHLFDLIEEGLSMNDDEQMYKKFKLTLEKQDNYETKLKSLFKEMKINTKTWNIPVLDW
ncbi:protein kinase family protein [Aquibacillus rhizosphaerae]|uniref:Spore coat protein YutH n=1 Tax=Aquibacillus rhizosphaerae TaxID=3051431 RepID=A0ABT7L7X1_9BACI|nr:hypothetical protein [Aquibacillus sp. LR5S19]MDL4841933.1 hypothetical protein [Aquibacillus sp. LR5S19]